MTNTVSAAATGLPSRRRALASLAGFGAVISLPRVAQAAAGLEAPDAVLIAHAAMVEDMAARYHTALTRWGDLTSTVDDAQPRRPDKKEVKAPSDSKVEYWPDGSVASIFLAPIDPAETRQKSNIRPRTKPGSGPAPTLRKTWASMPPKGWSTTCKARSRMSSTI